MTAAELTYRLALRAYPPGYRRARGHEILSTLADMQGDARRPSLRQAGALVKAGVYERGRAVTGGDRAGIWAEGCALAALVLLLLAATGAAFQLGWDIWYARLGMGWPLRGFSPVPLEPAGLVRVLAAALLPWGAALAVCRGRRLLPLAMALTAAALYVGGAVGFAGTGGYQSWSAGQSWMENAYQLGTAIFLAAPAGLLWVAGRGRRRPAAHRSLAWLALPAALTILHLASYWETTIVFWPLGAIMLAWFLAGRWSPHLAVAVFGVAVPVLAFVLPTAVGAPDYEYAVAVAAGAATLAFASLASALAFAPETELDPPAL
jgi:hypothetical protein